MTTQATPHLEPDLEALRAATGLLSANPSEAEQQLISLAERGSVGAMLQLGYLYWTSLPEAGKKDVTRAKKWFMLACDRESKEASFYLGRMYLEGAEYSEARKVFLVGDNLDYAPSTFHLGRIYRDGLGVEVNPDLALSYFARAADSGHIYAMRAMGRLLVSGKLGLRNIPKGLALVWKAARECGEEQLRNPMSERLIM